MKIQYKFLIIFLVAFAITIVPNLFLFKNGIIAWLPNYVWTSISIARFILLIGLFVVVTHYWIVKPLNRIARSLSLEDPEPVKNLSRRRDEIGKIGQLLERFFVQQKELNHVIKEKSLALESVALAEAKSRALLNAIPGFLFLINPAGIITDYNAPDQPELFLSPDKPLGKNIKNILPFHIITSYQKAIKELVSLNKIQVFEFTHHLPDGSENAYEATVSDTEIGDYLVSIRNITTRKEAELEVSRILSKQQELNKLKSRFISLVSHEFRTPLSAISSNIQLLSKYQEKWPAEKKAVVIKRVQKAISIMITLLEEVTLISKDQSGILSVNLEPLRINEFIHDLIEEIRKSNELPVSLELKIEDGEDYINSDKELLRQILLHLLSNAGKFNQEEKPVGVSVALENNHVEILITDHGIGIPESDMEGLFQPFHRGSNSDEMPGSGLGMSIVKRCIDLLHGSIRVNSTVNLGTTIEVRIPVNTTKTTMYEQDLNY